MKNENLTLQISILEVNTLEVLPDYWTAADHRALLDALDFGDSAEVADGELWDYLVMAIRELEPAQAAQVVLKYKLDDSLSEGQIEQISFDMLTDKISEEYPDISLHKDLFAVNQLLYKAYNGKFPRILASSIRFEAGAPGSDVINLTPALALQALAAGLDEHSVIKRLLDPQITGEEDFISAPHIAWSLVRESPTCYAMITSDYWISESDFLAEQFSAELHPFVDKVK